MTSIAPPAQPDSAPEALTRFYDGLSQHLLSADDRGGSDAYSMHRTLYDPRDPQRPPSPAVLNELIAERVPHTAPRGAHVLDAGCGWGGTLFHLCATAGVTGVGVTLSRVQSDRAGERAATLGLAERLSFRCADYNAHRADGAYDVVVMVETLHHNADRRRTLDRLCRTLRPGGRLLIVDDFLATAEVAADARCRAFMRGWQYPGMTTQQGLIADLTAVGLEPAPVHDLTASNAPRPNDETGRLIAEAVARSDALGPEDTDAKLALGGLIGGYYLEQLYVDRRMQYWMIEALSPA